MKQPFRVTFINNTVYIDGDFHYGTCFEICSYVTIKRQEALERVYDKLKSQQEDIIRRAVNSMSNSELASELHSEMYFYHVSGEGKLKAPWEKK